MPRLLSAEEVERQLADLPGWARDDNLLRASYTAPSFRAAVQLIVDLADEAEQMDHHPDVDLRWCTTRWQLSTHSAGGITQLDIEMAHRIAQSARRLAAEVDPQ